MPPITLVGDVPTSAGATHRTQLPLRPRVFTDGAGGLLVDLCANRKHVSPLDPAKVSAANAHLLAHALLNERAFELPGTRPLTWEPVAGRLSVHRHDVTLTAGQARKLAHLIEKATRPPGRRSGRASREDPAQQRPLGTGDQQDTLDFGAAPPSGVGPPADTDDDEA